MYRAGHLGVALLAWVPVGAGLVLAGAPGLAILGAGTMVGLSMLPDHDHDVPLIDHRGITHTLWFALAVGAIGGGVGWWLGVSGAGAAVLGLAPGAVVDAPEGVVLGAFGFGVGTFAILAHLLADALTPSGVPLLWPLSGRRYTLGLWRADNAVANYGLLALGAFSVAIAVFALAAV